MLACVCMCECFCVRACVCVSVHFVADGCTLSVRLVDTCWCCHLLMFCKTW